MAERNCWKMWSLVLLLKCLNHLEDLLTGNCAFIVRTLEALRSSWGTNNLSTKAHNQNQTSLTLFCFRVTRWLSYFNLNWFNCYNMTRETRVEEGSLHAIFPLIIGISILITFLFDGNRKYFERFYELRNTVKFNSDLCRNL